MGIFCNINLFKPPGDVYQPGQVVAGVIQYSLDESMVLEKIIVSFKGTGVLVLKDNTATKDAINRQHRATEVYFDIDNIIQDKKLIMPIGSYEVKFNFIIPENIPSSLNIHKFLIMHVVDCRIKHYIRIKFERPGFFTRNLHFRKEIAVTSGVIPRLLREPVILGEVKELTNLLSRKNSVNTVNIKGTILNSVIPVGGKIDVNFEVENNSGTIIKSVESKLVEVYKFKAKGHHEVEAHETIPNTDAKMTSIKCGENQSNSIQIIVPPDIRSLENSAIVSRNYVVRITAALPLPHRNAILNIPVQIGPVDENPTASNIASTSEDNNINYDDPPPTYWEAMGGTKRKESLWNDSDCDCNEAEK